MYRKVQHSPWKAVNTQNILLVIIIVDYPKAACWYTEKNMASRKY